MYEREVFIIVLTVVPIALALYYGYRSGHLWYLQRLFNREK